MKTYLVRPEFSQLQQFTETLPDTFDQTGLVIHNSRNVIKKIITDEGTFVVKNFKGMYLFNRLAYSFFRRSKAVRSYLYSGMLNDKGIITPPHVAWIDCYKLGLLTQSYFVSVYFQYETLDQVIQYYDVYDRSYKVSLFRDLAAFALKLHKLGIYHPDFSLGNILVIRSLSGYQFAMVDLNRVKFKKVQYRDALRNFITLRMAEEDQIMLVREYALQANRSAEGSIAAFLKDQDRKMSFRRLRRKIRRYTLTPLEKLLFSKNSH
jgi:serine/threonine protein kinase